MALNSERVNLDIREKLDSKEQFRYKEDIFYSEGGETLAQVAWGGGRCPIPGNIQGQVGWGAEQPDPVEDFPACCREGWIRWS